MRDVIYLGVKGTALALNRANGEILWKTQLGGWDFVNLMLDDDVVLATTKGRSLLPRYAIRNDSLAESIAGNGSWADHYRHHEWKHGDCTFRNQAEK